MKRQTWVMRKKDVLKAYGGSAVSTARALGITPQAVSNWKPILTERTSHRAIAGLFFRAPKPVHRGLQVLLFRNGGPDAQRLADEFLDGLEQLEAAEASSA